MLPQEFVDRMQKMMGEDFNSFLESFEKDKYQALRINALKGNSEVEMPFHLSPVPWTKNGWYYQAEDFPGKHPYHEAGVYYIQEPSAMAPVGLLDPKPGEYVLDLCAAPGGKSTQIAALLNGEGLLIANEIHPARAKILSENVERMGIRNAIVTNETPAHLADNFEEYFDKILVDAPCSGEGMFRKNEDAQGEWSLENVELCGERQDQILDCAAKMLRTGGRICYSTCTFAPIENEGSISRFLQRHPEFTIVAIDKSNFESRTGDSDGVASWVEAPADGIEKTLRLWPHILKGEGHFVALLQKTGELSDNYFRMPAKGLQDGIGEKELKQYREFEKDTLKTKMQGTFLKFGENLYVAPENMPALKGLKVLRPGLQLGALKKDRFEPSHALALALKPEEACNNYNFDTKEGLQGIKGYQGGLTFQAEGEKGWYLISVDGFSTGWGKLAGGTMKNHYPKGLRKNAY